MDSIDRKSDGPSIMGHAKKGNNTEGPDMTWVLNKKENQVEDEELEENTDLHWIQRLFPPAHEFTLNELVSDVGKVPELEEESTFDVYARGSMTPLDASSVKNVYERVWLLQALQDELRQGLMQPDGRRTLKDTFTLTRGGGQTVEMRHITTDTVDLLQETSEEESLWNSDEIAVLRKVFQKTKTRNKELAAALTELNERHEAMKAKHKAQHHDLDAQTRKLHEAIKSNKRLYILSNNLNTQIKAAHTKIDFLRRQIETFKKDRETFEQEAHEARLALDAERLQREKSEAVMQRQTKETLRNQQMFEDKVKAKYELEVNSLRRRVRELEEDLANERQEHLRSKKGLEHLRTHFASLPYAENVKSTNMVVEDQLKQWSL